MPLEHRVPNPPAVFVGRARELQRMVDALTRSPVLWVWGVGGVGKTSMVAKLVLDARRPGAPEAIFVPAARCASEQELIAAVTRALRATEDDDERRARRGDPDASIPPIDVVIDMADAAGRDIVIDDLGEAIASESRALLGKIARYSRTARWLFTARVRPPAEIPDLLLGGLGREDALDLLRVVAPTVGAAEAEAHYLRTAGSPWHLVGQANGASMTGAPDMLAGCTRAECRLLERMAVVEAELPMRDLMEEEGTELAETLSRLARRGLVQGTIEATRLHDLARVDVLQRLTEARRRALQREVAEALSASSSASANLEALRLWLASGDRARALELLDAKGNGILEERLGIRLWPLLRDELGASFKTWRLCAALDGGPKSALDTLDLSDASPAHLHRVASAHLYFGDRDRAYALARDIALRAEPGSKLRFDAELLCLRASRSRGVAGFEAQRALVESLEPTSEADEAQKIVQRALVARELGDRETVIASIEPLRARVHALPARQRWIAVYDLARSVARVGLPRAAARLVDELMADSPMAAHVGRGDFALELWRASIACELGELVSALARLDALVDRALDPAARVWVSAVRAPVAYWRGEADAADAMAAAWFNDDPAFARLYGAEMAAVRMTLHRSFGRRPEGEAWERAGEGETSQAALLRAHAQRWWGRWDEARSVDVPHEALDGTETELNHALARAEGRLLRGEISHAIELLDDVIARADHAGYVTIGWDALEVKLDAALLGGHGRGVAEIADQLSALATPPSAGRLEAFAAWARISSSEATLLPEALESLVASASRAPELARRASALLGDSVPLDRLDRALVDALRSRRGRAEWRTVRAPSSAPRTPGESIWGYDAVRQVAWGSKGWTVRLSEKPIAAELLRVLAEHALEKPGELLDKETLAMRVWKDRVYNPTSHDNRLRVAVRSLRELLDPEGTELAESALCSDEAGYRCRLPFRYVR